jgi:beta-N-acetylhexosaminidase
LRFKGLLVTDDISMQALSGPLAQRAEAALAAGCDVVTHCNGRIGEMDAVVSAAGRFAPDAAARARAALTWRSQPRSIDIAAAEAEFRSLMTGQETGQA